MTIWVSIALFGFPLLSVAMFGFLQPRQAALWSFLLATLFLPMASFKFPLLPAYDKVAAASVGVLLGSFMFDSAHLLKFRPRWCDLPMIVLCIVPCISCVSAGLGVFAGIAAMLTMMTSWGCPYFIGRIYFPNAVSLRTLVIGIAIAGLIYVPFCLYEVRMSPVLSTMIYGFHPHSFIQERRYGGFRPVVFMQHGLAVAAWMSATATLSFWIWRTRIKSTLAGLPVWAAFFILVGVVLLCKTFGALLSLIVGVSAAFFTRYVGFRVPLLVLALAAPTYMFIRTTGVLSTNTILGWSSIIADSDRTSSLSVRLASEDHTIPRILERPVFGYGWGQYQDAITDGMWLIFFGRYGVVGLTAWTLVFILPALVLVRQLKKAKGNEPTLMLAFALCLLLCLHLLDDLMNGMFNATFVLASGALLAQSWPVTPVSSPRVSAANKTASGYAGRRRLHASTPRPIPNNRHTSQ